jgi:aspartyl-tRNA(Asn)/glutamyl-tRNA(Gln) amidotransferase subunit A
MTESAAATRDKELCYLGASQLTRHFRTGELSPVEVTQAVLRRIDRLEPSLNAFVLVDPEAALASAKASEFRYRSGLPLSELDGVTVSLKDLLLTRGWPTRKGSRTTSATGPWLEDSPAAARLREAGAVLLGKTTTTEFGLKGLGDSPLTGITRNPWNLAHSPGGSSAGAVAAVAAGLGTLAVGTDGGGSIRVPAAFSGVVGLKPTFGRVPTYPAGVIGAPPHVGPITRRVQDAALLLRILTGQDDRDPFRLPPEDPGPHYDAGPSSLAGLRVGYSARLFPAELSPELTTAFERTVQIFRELGATLSPIEDRFDSAAPILTTLFHARAAFTVKDLSAPERALLDPTIEAAAREGEALGLLDYLSAEAARTSLAQGLAALHRRFDLLLTPSTGELAPKVDAEPSALRAPFTGAFSLTRQPALSIPTGQSQAGLPIGLQIVGRHFEEALVLRAAAAFETRVPFVAPPL